MKKILLSRLSCFKIVFYISLSVFISGCTTLPSFGPSSNAIEQASQNKNKAADDIVDFELINISPATLPHGTTEAREYFSPFFLNQRFIQSNQQIAPGDVLKVTIWEAANEGLFASQGKRETTFTLSVSNSGDIDVPYAGNVQVIGQSISDIRAMLLRLYKGKAIDPEINILAEKNFPYGVSLLGDIARPGRLNIPKYGLKLLDVIALSGGIEYSPWEVQVTVSRLHATSSVGLDSILAESIKNNIVILPGDVIHVSHLPRRYAIYGAISRPGNIAIDAPSFSLSDMLAEAGGLHDVRAESRSVFIFRQYQDASKSKIATPLKDVSFSEKKSVAYRLNFSKPDAFLLASNFEMAASDIVYIAEAGASEFNKFIRLLVGPFFGSANSVNNINN